MYKTFTAEDWKKQLRLPADYHVDGMLCYGTWNKDQQVELFKDVIEQHGKKYEYGVLPSFLEKLLEFNIEGKRYWFDVSYGGALLSEYLHLASMFGSKKNILLGSCGGLAPGISGLDMVIPTYSYGDESPTRMYDPEAIDHKHYSNENLSQNLKNRIGTKYKVWDGGTTTCQAMMAETWEDVQEWSKEGFISVEMEAATVFAVSKHFKVPAAALLRVGDNLIEKETIRSESYELRREKSQEIKRMQYEVALAELLS